MIILRILRILNLTFGSALTMLYADIIHRSVYITMLQFISLHYCC